MTTSIGPWMAWPRAMPAKNRRFLALDSTPEKTYRFEAICDCCGVDRVINLVGRANLSQKQQLKMAIEYDQENPYCQNCVIEFDYDRDRETWSESDQQAYKLVCHSLTQVIMRQLRAYSNSMDKHGIGSNINDPLIIRTIISQESITHDKLAEGLISMDFIGKYLTVNQERAIWPTDNCPRCSGMDTSILCAAHPAKHEAESFFLMVMEGD